MAKTVEENANIILATLAELPRPTGSDATLTGEQLAEITTLSPEEINDAVTILVEAGFVEWLQVMGTGPFDFLDVHITPRGRYEYERASRNVASKGPTGSRVIRPPSPVGSPFGFTDQDWELVADRKNKNDTLYVVLGFQFSSQFYDSHEIKNNVEDMFQLAVEKYNQMPASFHAVLNFHALEAGYGEHLFNEIARDIISADIAVFETSDLNPNVMIEIGVALTWGVRGLILKKEGRPKPPTDISGQTWADYRDSAKVFLDPEHVQKLVRMVERAMRKKGASHLG